MDYICLVCGKAIAYDQFRVSGFEWYHKDTNLSQCSPPFYGSAIAFRD